MVIEMICETEAQTLLRRDFLVSRERGKTIRSDLAPHVMATVHPSALLRAPDEATRHREIARFIAELRLAAVALKKTA